MTSMPTWLNIVLDVVLVAVVLLWWWKGGHG